MRQYVADGDFVVMAAGTRVVWGVALSCRGGEEGCAALRLWWRYGEKLLVTQQA